MTKIIIKTKLNKLKVQTNESCDNVIFIYSYSPTPLPQKKKIKLHDEGNAILCLCYVMFMNICKVK